MTRSGTHEDFSRHTEVRGSSDRSFGLLFAVVFLLVGLFPLWGGEAVRIWALGLAGVLLIVALARPGLLHPLNRVWLALGLLLHRIVSPVALGVVFFLAVTPTGLLMRLLGKRPLALDADPSTSTYWKEREDVREPRESMGHQF